MPDSLINLLTQIPLVGIFVWFILEWSKRIDAKESRRDELWMNFLREERAHRAEATERLAEEIKRNTQEVSRLNGAITAHDAASRARSS